MRRSFDLLAIAFFVVVYLLLWVYIAKAETFFTNPPQTITIDTTGLAAQMMANYNKIRSDGNAAEAELLSRMAIAGPAPPFGGLAWFDSDQSPLDSSSFCPAINYLFSNGSNGTPDVRGVFVRGLDLGRGIDPGRVLATLQGYLLQDHTHSSPLTIVRYSDNNHSGASIGAGSDVILDPGNASNLPFNIGYPSPNSILTPVYTQPISIVLEPCMSTVTAIVAPQLGFISDIRYFGPVPNLFINFTLTNAAQTMANFQALVDRGNEVFNDLAAQIAALQVPGIPPNAITAFNSTTCPVGWDLLDGSPAPDLRGEFVRPLGTGLTLGGFQNHAMKDHTHFYSSGTGFEPVPVASFVDGPRAYVSSVTSIWTPTTVTNSLTVTVNGAVAPIDDPSNIGTETRPYNVALTYCKFTGVGSSVGVPSGEDFGPMPFQLVDTTPPSTPADASQVMANYQALINGANAAANKIQAYIEIIKNQFSSFPQVQTGTILYFDQASCPAGWTRPTAYDTYFPRGRDAGRGLDPNPVVTVGTFETDNFSKHTHGSTLGGSGTVFMNQDYAVGSKVLGSGNNGFFGLTLHNEPVLTGNPNTGNASTETRPRNVALLLCEKD